MLKLDSFDPSDDLYGYMVRYLYSDDLKALSLVSREIYRKTYVTALDVLGDLHKPLVLRPLALSDRVYPPLTDMLGKCDTLFLVKRAYHHRAFAAHPRHAQSVIHLEKFFQKRREVSSRIEQERELLRTEYQKWMEDSVFNNSEGIEVLTIFKNIYTFHFKVPEISISTLRI